MLLEIENQLHRRVHNALGQSAVVIRLAEEIDESGRVAEQAMIIVSWAAGSTTNPNKGAYIPTVRNRKLNYTITLVQKQTQREGHSFSLPILDLIADSVTGWVPEVPGLEFQTGFELGPERFVQVTEASQFIYEQTYSIEVLIPDGRFYSQPCAAFDPISVEDFLPKRKCLFTPDQKGTGLAVWRRVINSDTTEEYVVEDPRCEREISDNLEITCNEAFDGSATYVFTPRAALSFDENGDRVIDEDRIVTGTLSKVWKCYRDRTQPYPPWFKLNIDSSLWRNSVDTVPNTKPGTSARQDLNIKLNPAYDTLT
jgi:hypothetical protein